MALVEGRCPICRKQVLREGNRWWPFCSDRCELIDLGRWATDLLFRHGDPLDLAQKLQNLLNMANKQWQAMGMELRQSVVEWHSLKRLTERLMALFKEVRR